MKIFSVAQLQAWDRYTIEREPIRSSDLMERAATTCVNWIQSSPYRQRPFLVLCGAGNNGGDGLAIARLLKQGGSMVQLKHTSGPEESSADFRIHFQLALEAGLKPELLTAPDQLEGMAEDTVLIDCLFGSGLNREPSELLSALIRRINQLGWPVIAIDLPSGLFTDRPSNSATVVRATVTLSLQVPKLAFMSPQNSPHTGRLVIIDIGLHPGFPAGEETSYRYADTDMARSIYKPRDPASHKGSFGHALLVAGSYGKMGAAVLAGTACLRSGAGLLTCHIPASGYEVVQTVLPEAMVSTDFNSSFNTKLDTELSGFRTIGIGPGMGTASESANLLKTIMEDYQRPMVIDADALNIMGRDRSLLQQIPPGSILTPHPKEFERLFGETANDFDRFELALAKAKELNCIIILKGQYSLLALPEGKGIFNSTGNPALAKGGSGDTLTGMIMAMLCQNYAPADAALLAVYLHGLAADIYIRNNAMESMMATDLSRHISQAFRELNWGT